MNPSRAIALFRRGRFLPFRFSLAAAMLALGAASTVRSAAPAYATPYVFTTLAGTASIGSADGLPSTARFNGPYAVAVDSAGNLYVADNWNRTIRKISTANVVSTLAGSAGNYGSLDGSGSSALFGNPWGVAVDSGGNVYVSDSYFNTIRKITPGGLVTTFAGAPGTSGSSDGTGTSARFSYPAGLATDAMGDVYVADSGNRTIRKITPGGVVTTVAGLAGSPPTAVDGIGSAARFISLNGLAVDSAGNLYVTDENTVRKITSSGSVTTLAGVAGSANGGIDDGQGSAARFNAPYGVAVDSGGNVFVADTWNNSVRKITPSGTVSTVAGLPAGYPPATGSAGASDGTGSAARFNFPQDVAVDTAGNVFVADTHNNMIRKITPGGIVSTIAGVSPLQSTGIADGSGAAARFSAPHGAAIDSAGNVFVADTDNSTIRKVTSSGTVTTFAGSAGNTGSTDATGTAARFLYPVGVVIDRNGTLYVSDTGNQTIRKISPAGAVTTFAGSVGFAGAVNGLATVAQFNQPYGLAVDSAGNVFAADSGNFTIRRISTLGAVTTLAGIPGTAGAADGPAASATFTRPEGVAVDGSGNVFVADAGAFAIRKISPSGTVTTFAGLAGSSGSVDGTGGAARFVGPEAIAIDAAGNLFVADNINYTVRETTAAGFPVASSGNYTIRKITPAGVVLTIAGWERDSTDGAGSDARFDIPFGLAVSSGGHVYVTASSPDSNTLRDGQAVGAPVITTQPQSMTVAPGTSAQFSVSASGAPAPAYQWFLNGTALSGATSSTLSVSNAQSSNAGSYTVTVTNAMGSVTSSPATLTVSSGGTTTGGTTTGGASGSGGGAVSTWWMAAMVLLFVYRRKRTPHWEA